MNLVRALPDVRAEFGCVCALARGRSLGAGSRPDSNLCRIARASAAFRSLHDVIFSHRSDIRVESARESLILNGREASGLDLNAYRSCVEDELTLGLVQRDVKLAGSLGVAGTPTAFVNGKRVEPPGSIEALEKAINVLQLDQR
ncbi:MAG: thioredoxin domain-containing protein [Acidobacteriota bacterium]|nr:thioredoxin domain-containing protein [Acidobacteriota bacterium]